jgi:hypothetical protein
MSPPIQLVPIACHGLRRIAMTRSIQALEQLIGLDICKADFYHLTCRLQDLPTEVQHTLMTISADLLTNQSTRPSELNRVAGVRVIVGLLPVSAASVQEFLSRFFTRFDYEVHFTFFCYFEHVQRLGHEPELIEMIAQLSGEYLRRVERFTAMSAWMAGEMLGNHWEIRSALSHLLRALFEARFVAGRCGALHGLHMLLKPLRLDASDRRRVISALRRTAKEDRSRTVRERSAFLLRSTHI